MNKKMVQWLYQELPGLVSNGVISEESAHKLREHYGEIKSVGKKWFVIVVCSVLGALLIGLGIISLFAHNWEDLSRPVRTVLSLLPLLAGQGFALWVFLNRPQSDSLKESSATFLSLMVGSAMALITQTYHITGNTADFVLSWMLLIVPLVYFLKATIPAMIYVVGISAWVGFFWDKLLEAFFFWPLLAVIVPHFIWGLKEDKYSLRSALLALVLATGVCFGAGFSLGKWLPSAWIIIYSCLTTIFYFLGTWEFKGISTQWQGPFHVLGGLGVFVMMFLLGFKFPWEFLGERPYFYHYDLTFWQALPDYILTFFLVGISLLMFFQCVKRKDGMCASFGALPLVALTGYALGGYSPDFSMILFNVFLFAVSIIRIRLGIRLNNLGVINSGMLMLAALILARFFGSEMNFVIKGLIFIGVGIGFLATNAMILRRKGGES
ncbi:MAG: DUF2157 domain-containing protein [Candidatus Omnitrophica bacterium]|nr:DUF2157 domain-containing protein [Candidatus Omnitrophota bacterium]